VGESTHSAQPRERARAKSERGKEDDNLNLTAMCACVRVRACACDNYQNSSPLPSFSCSLSPPLGLEVAVAAERQWKGEDRS
jgi:hypothetical protein